MKRKVRDLHQMTFDNPAVTLIRDIKRWEDQLKAEGWDEYHIKRIVRNRIRRAERRAEGGTK